MCCCTLAAGLQDVPATLEEFTTTDIAAALSIAGVAVKSGSSKRVQCSEGHCSS